MEEILNNQSGTTQLEKLTKDQRYYRKKKAKEKEKDEKLATYSSLSHFLLLVTIGLIGLLCYIGKSEKKKEIEKKEEKPIFPLLYIPMR
uniref:Uncharacterized protein n=1 Tax=Dictyoglomus turgidum TaxID=513050 RepID=A0A7C3SP60_9BACT